MANRRLTIITPCRVSCVRFSPNAMNPVIVSAGWDKVVKVGNFDRLSRAPIEAFKTGLGAVEMQAPHKPLRSYGLHQHRGRFP